MTGLLATKSRPADVPALAEAALWQELELTPKPGWWTSSITVPIAIWTTRCSSAALRRLRRGFRVLPSWVVRMRINPLTHSFVLSAMGMACEQAMYAATNGVNTHKGGIFALGLLCFAAGRVKNISASSLCCEVSNICSGLVSRELAARSGQATAGERQFQQYG